MHFTQLLLSLVLCSTITSVAAQKVVKKKAPGDWDYVFTKVEIESGTNQQDWDSYMRKSTVLPDSLAESIPPGRYNVLISFVINVDGTVSNVKAENDPGYGLAARALMIFKGYQGKWRPGIQCGRMVKSYKKEPVIFIFPE